MAYNNSNPKNQINTDGLALYSSNSCMRLDFWSTAVSIKLYPAKPEEEQTEMGSRFDFKKRVHLTLSADNAVLAGKLIEKEILPALEEGKAAHFGLISAKVNMFYVSTGVEEFGKVQPYVALFCEINESRKPEKMMTFKFENKRVITKYNAETGETEMKDDPSAQLKVLAEFLKSAILLYGQTAHSYAYHNADRRNNEDILNRKMAEQYGISLQEPVHYASRAAQKDPWNSAPSAPTNSNEAVISSVSSMEDINGLLLKTKVKGLKPEHLNGHYKTKGIRLQRF